MIKNITEKNCAGCLACEGICPKNAITHDMCGEFIYPHINTELCVECGLCKKVCPKENAVLKSEYNKAAYAAKNKDATVIKNSTSGGVFSALAKMFINQNGVVYGCEMINNRPVCVRTETDYSGMRGSKYVQCDMSGVHKKIAADLKNGRKVLFTGTPCQCAGMRNFLNMVKNSENVLLVDFICHGVPSPKIYDDWSAYYEKKTKKKIVKHVFRSKIRGWTNHTEVNYTSDGKSDMDTYYSQLFKGIFHSRLAMNKACFKCEYASTERVSDITIADFWGIQKSHPELFDENGVSFVLLNSEKGRMVFERCDDLEKHSVDICDTAQPHLYKPADKPAEYDLFWRDYRKRGFEYIAKKYYHGGWLYRKLSDVYHTLKKIKL